MSTALNSDQTISEHLLEIRYKPNPKILDYRGTWAEMVSKIMELDHWQIDANRIDVFDDNQLRRAFVSFKNFGMIIQNSSTKNYFPDQANKLVRFLLNQDAFGKDVFIERIGVRSRFAIPFAGTFQELLDYYLSNFIDLKNDAKLAFNATITDIANPFNFSTEYGYLNTNTGPMEQEQLSNFFIQKDDLPKIALYIDLDYWSKPNKEMNSPEITRLVKLFSEGGWDIHENIVSTVLCGK